MPKLHVSAWLRNLPSAASPDSSAAGPDGYDHAFFETIKRYKWVPRVIHIFFFILFVYIAGGTQRVCQCVYIAGGTQRVYQCVE